MFPSLDRLSVEFAMDEILSNLETIKDIFAILGAFYAANLCLKVTYACYRAVKVYVLPKFWFKHNFRSRYGEWAVVTGASEGIGERYCIELAKRGMNIVLISRNLCKLEKVVSQIEKFPGIKTKIITADFNDDECYQRIEDGLTGLEVGVLVNNVGIMYDRLQYFLTVSPERLKQIVNLNIMATVMMTRMVLEQMVQRRKGVVINISSGACVQPVPMMTAYSAAKIYTDYFSRALNYEYQSKGVTVQSVQPFYVSTRMTNFMKPNILVPDARTYVDHALRTLPFTSRTFGFWSHGLWGVIGGMLPEWFFFWATINVNMPLWNYLSGCQSGPDQKLD